VEAQLHLAELHFFGNVNMGVHEDQAIARRYFEQAAEQNDPHALYNLGIMET
jgi:TPR repeat protein